MEYFNEIKNLIEKNEINQRKYNYYKNESLVETYFNIGKLLVEAQGGKHGVQNLQNFMKKVMIHQI